MKTRIVFALALCFASSLVFADNPSDAPLVSNDTGYAVPQQDARAKIGDQQQGKKEVSSSEKMAKDSCKSQSKNTKRDSEDPAKTSTASSL